MWTVPAGYAELTQSPHNVRSHDHVLARVRNEYSQGGGSPRTPPPTLSRRHRDSGGLLQELGDFVSCAACIRLRNRWQASQDPRRTDGGLHENSEDAILEVGGDDCLFDFALDPHRLRRATRHKWDQEISSLNRAGDIGRPVDARVHIESGMRKSVSKGSGPGSVVRRVRQEHPSRGFRHATSSLELKSASVTKSLKPQPPAAPASLRCHTTECSG